MPHANLLAALMLLASSATAADQPLVDLYCNTIALQTMREFRLTREQLDAASKSIAAPATPSGTIAENPALRQALSALRDALLKGDDDRLDPLEEKLESLTDDLDLPEWDPTPAARSAAAQLFASLKPDQLAHYVAANVDLIRDPQSELIDAMDSLRGMEFENFKTERDDAADWIAAAVAGFDPKKVDDVTEQVKQLLTRAYKLSDTDFKQQRAELVKGAQQIAGKVDAITVIRNLALVDLADLLSNPQFKPAMQGRIAITKPAPPDPAKAPGSPPAPGAARPAPDRPGLLHRRHHPWRKW